MLRSTVLALFLLGQTSIGPVGPTAPNPCAEKVLFSASNLALTTAGTSEEVLKTVPIPGGALVPAGAYAAIDFEIGVIAAANANAKTYNVRIGGIAGTSIASVSADTTSADRYAARGRLYGYGTTELNGVTVSTQRTGSSFIFLNAAIGSLNLTTGTELTVTATTASAAGDLTLTNFRLVMIPTGC